MSFDDRDVRPGLDVFTSDGVYAGTVVYVERGAPAASRVARSDQPAHGAGQPDIAPGPPARLNGEALGPMPTVALGNSGPVSQTRTSRYASLPEPVAGRTRPPTTLLLVRVLTALDWRTLKPVVRRIPVSLIQAVSLERIVLSVTAADLGLGARSSPLGIRLRAVPADNRTRET